MAGFKIAKESVPTESTPNQYKVMDTDLHSNASADDKMDEDFVFEHLYDSDEDKISIKNFFEDIEKVGLRTSDPRLANTIKNFNALKPLKFPSVQSLKLDPEIFKSAIGENSVLIKKAIGHRLVIPAFEAFTENIKTIYNECLQNTEGTASDANQQFLHKWGVSVCTVDGQRFSIGNALDHFTVKDISKPISYAISLNNLNKEVVHKYQGREPSGNVSHAIALDYNNKPHNPLVESGAIMSASLILQLVKPELDVLSQKYEYIHQFFEQMAGGEYIGFNNSEFLAERLKMDQQKALAYFMRENHCFPEGVNLEKTLDFHNQINAIEVTCESSSVIAATLANGGVCPITLEIVLDQETIGNVLSLMYSCGMHLYSGEFAFDIGLPAMSSGHGALMVVIPNVMGITLWSPKLDSLKNSVRGVEFCKKLLQLYNFHRFDGLGHSLQKHDPTLQERFLSPFLQTIQTIFAASTGDLEYLKRAYVQLSDINASNSDERTALHLASAEGHLECVRFLLYGCRANPFCKDRCGSTPYDDAVKYEQIDVIKLYDRYLEKYPNGIPELSDEEDQPNGDMDDPPIRNLFDLVNSNRLIHTH